MQNISQSSSARNNKGRLDEKRRSTFSRQTNSDKKRSEGQQQDSLIQQTKQDSDKRGLEVLTEVIEDSDTLTGKHTQQQVKPFGVQLPNFHQKSVGMDKDLDDDNLVEYCDELLIDDNRYVKPFASQSLIQPTLGRISSDKPQLLNANEDDLFLLR